MLTRRTTALRRQMAVDDSGFSLIESVIACVILALAVTMVAALLVGSLGVVKNNGRRTTAAGLAGQQIEAARAMRALDIADGSATTPKTVGGTTYQVTQTAEYVQSGSGVNACNGTGSLAYKLITVTVSWPNMGSVKPIRSDTLRALGFGNDGLTATQGAAAVAVQGLNGRPVSGIQVSLKTSPGGVLTGTPQTTGADGCVVFAGVTANQNYTASVNTTGYVDQDGVQNATSTVFGITASAIAKPVLSYDQASTLRIAPQAPATYTAPSNLAMTLQTSLWSPSQKRGHLDCATVSSSPKGCVSGTNPRLATALFPGPYTAWAGSCNDAPPATIPPNVTVQPSAPTDITASLAGVDVLPGVLAVGRTVYAVHNVDAFCTLGETYNLGALPSTGLKIALPYGTWRLLLTSSWNALATAQEVVLTATTTPPTVTVTL